MPFPITAPTYGTYAYFKSEVGGLMKYGHNEATYTHEQRGIVDAIVQRGVRAFYSPLPLTPEEPSYQWSFLRRSATISLTVAAGSDYDLPADFVSLTADPVVSETDGGRVERVAWQDVLAMRARGSAVAAVPMYCAARPKTPDATAETAFELLVYPTPDATMTMDYRYTSQPPVLDSTNEYPVGGKVHTETILEACLSAAEEEMGKTDGVHSGRFALRLAASILADRGVNA